MSTAIFVLTMFVLSDSTYVGGGIIGEETRGDSNVEQIMFNLVGEKTLEYVFWGETLAFSPMKPTL